MKYKSHYYQKHFYTAQIQQNIRTDAYGYVIGLFGEISFAAVGFICTK
jgi:hypothetical protein